MSDVGTNGDSLHCFVGNFPCPLSPSGVCKHGGNKAYNYGFVRGTASYCRKAKKWVHDLDICPVANTEIEARSRSKLNERNEIMTNQKTKTEARAVADKTDPHYEYEKMRVEK